MKLCPKCNMPVFSKGLCKYHWKIEYGKPLPKAKDPIKKVSELQGLRMKAYHKKRKEWLKEHRECEAKLEGCTHDATQVHHRAGRTGMLLLDETKWLAICFSCHVFITENSLSAINSGLSLKRNT